MSLREFLNAIDGYTEQLDWQFKKDLECARYIAKPIVSVQVDKKSKGKLDKAFELPWDKDKKGRKKRRKLTLEEIRKEEEKTIRFAKKLQKILG